jgi:hypothetical protein
MNDRYGYVYDGATMTIIPNPLYPYPLLDSTLTEEKGLETP